MKAYSIFIPVLLASCTGRDASRSDRPSHHYKAPDGSFSVDAAEDWTASIDRGASLFVPAKGGKQTIVVRSSTRHKELKEGHQASNDDLANATADVLGRLPSAAIEKRWKVSGDGLSGEAFSVRFTPQTVHQPYHRTHVVLFGKSKLFHVIYTAPADDTIDESALNEMVSSLREEV